MARPWLLSIVLLSLTVLGALSLHGFGYSNGFFELVENVARKQVLPDKNIRRGEKSITGIKSIDDTILVFLTFFWPLTQGDNPGLSLLGILFAGQNVAGWTITMIEGQRRGNAMLWASCTTIYGLVMQSTGFAVIGPAWLLLHSLTAKTIRNPTTKQLEASEAAIKAIPYSIGLGFIIPSLLMALPYPAVWSLNTKMNLILVWQIFPLYIQIFQFVLEKTIFATSQPCSNVRQIWLLQGTYKFAMFISVWINVAVCGISVAAYAYPDVFEGPQRLQMTPQEIFVPPNPFDKSLKVRTVSRGTIWFLQWDYLISGGAYLVWALYLKHARAGRKFTVIELIGDLSIKPLVMGPMAAALSCISSRDQEVFDAEEVGKKQL